MGHGRVFATVAHARSATTTLLTTASLVSSTDDQFQITFKGQTVTVPVNKGNFYAAKDLAKLGLKSFDPGLVNTAVARSAISSIDGEKGELRYRGYDIETLVDRCSYLEVTFLLIHGELPTRDQLEEFETRTLNYSFVHEDLKHISSNFRFDAHPMGFLMSSIAALGTLYPAQNPALQGGDLYKNNPELVNQQIYRIMGKLPTLAAFAYRHRTGRAYNDPPSGEAAVKLGYSGCFLWGLDRLNTEDYKPNPVIQSALEKLFIIHAEHGLNASTNALRSVSSCGTDVYSCISSALAALLGPSHGGANAAVLAMLENDVRTVENIPKFLESVKRKETRLMGFGHRYLNQLEKKLFLSSNFSLRFLSHRVYRNVDPRSRIIRGIAEEVFEVCGRDPMIEVAEALAEAALQDEYFSSRKLFPNVDFYSGLIYSAIGFPVDFFPVLFALGRVAGWLAHWRESILDPETKIYRPKQLSESVAPRDFISLSKRAASKVNAPNLRPVSTSGGRVKQRRLLSKL